MGRRLDHDLTGLAQWWTQAKDEARWALLERAIKGDPQTPPLEKVRLAALIAEATAGQVVETR